MYPDVNAMLTMLVARIQQCLEDNFIGAYVQGSLAVGDFNSASDVDVVIAIRHDLKSAEIETFQALHRELFAELPPPWGQRLELSYQPISILRRWSQVPRDPPDDPRTADWRDPSISRPPTVYPYWYLDNGAQKLVRSEHDNTRVVRWVMREKGITLSGPKPMSLIDAVSRHDLALEIHDMLRSLTEEWSTPEAIDTAWLQGFFVIDLW